MKSIFITIILSLFVVSAFAHSITGFILDKEEPLYGATVVVLDQKDSIMLAFGISDDSGKFLIYDVPEGELILQISYTGYSDYHQNFIMKSTDEIKDMEAIILEKSTATLPEVSIKAEHIPMGILGDTINYNASAFNTKPGATVEDLLKKMPGIEVARDGSIKAQGEEVKNVLVDGKEFFSGDPTMATKNLEAEAVDKVQVFDKQSEEAEFTGVDDGQEEKTINLKLKEEYKNGGFGKAAAEVGTEDRRQLKLNYNRFSPSIQASILGNANNINEQAFSFREYVDFMGGFSNVLGSGGMSDNGYTGLGNSQGGIANQGSIGSNLNIDITKKVQLNINYLFSSRENILKQTSSSENFTNRNSFITMDSTSAINKSTNHRFNSKLKYKINPHHKLSFNAKALVLNTNDIESGNTNYSKDNFFQNKTENDIDKEGMNYKIDLHGLYNVKFDKKGRSLATSIKHSFKKQSEELLLNNSIRHISIFDQINQKQSLSSNANSYSFSSKYTEPIGKKTYLSIKYLYSSELQNPEKKFYNKTRRDYELDEDLTGEFDRSWIYHQGTLGLKKNYDKLKVKLGVSAMQASLAANNEQNIDNPSSTYQYLLPSMSLNWDVKASSKMKFTYRTKVHAPSLNQLLTIPNNENPNILILGNPDLKPEYKHSFGLNYTTFDQFNFSNLFAHLNFSISENKIVNSTQYKDNLTLEVQPINALNYISASFSLNHSRPIRKLKIKYNINSTISYDKYTTLLDDNENDVSSAKFITNLMFENRNKEVFDISTGIKYSLMDHKSSNSNSFNEAFINYSLYTDAFWNITESFNCSLTYDRVTYGSALGTNIDAQHLIDIEISKMFIENRLIISLSANDLLNQNKGINRSGNQYSLTETHFNSLGRYFMLGLSYRIGEVKKDDGVFKI